MHTILTPFAHSSNRRTLSDQKIPFILSIGFHLYPKFYSTQSLLRFHPSQKLFGIGKRPLVCNFQIPCGQNDLAPSRKPVFSFIQVKNKLGSEIVFHSVILNSISLNLGFQSIVSNVGYAFKKLFVFTINLSWQIFKITMHQITHLYTIYLLGHKYFKFCNN